MFLVLIIAVTSLSAFSILCFADILTDKLLKDMMKKEEEERENTNRCIYCGVIIPEGRHVCPECEAKI